MDYTKALMVDNDLRRIAIPQAVPLLGVTNDNAVNEIFFVIPATYGEIDLSDFTVYVNWMNAGGEVGVSETTAETSEDETTIVRKWTVGSGECKYAGECEFILCLKYNEQEYNTQRASLPVYAGIEPDDITVEKYNTALSEMVERIQELAGKYAWNGTTWADLSKYETTRRVTAQNAATASEAASAAIAAKNTSVTTKNQIEQYIADISEESNRISDIYNVLDNANVNICPREYLEINQGSSSGIINGTYQKFGHVYAGETYTFSADITMSPLPGRLECRIKPDGGGADIEGVFYIDNGRTGRVPKTFTAAGTGELFFSGKLTGHTGGEKVLERCQLEEGYGASEYAPYGELLVADAKARNDIAEMKEQIEDLSGKASSLKNILSVGHMGYSGYGATANTLQAFKDASKYGYDWVELDVYATLDHVFVVMHDGKVDTATATNVDVWTVNYSDITSDVLRFNSAVYTCNLYNLGMVIEFNGTRYNSTDYTNMKRIMNSVNVPHAYVAWSVSNLVNIRAKEPEAHVILVLTTKPTLEDLQSGSSFESLRTLAGQDGKTDLCFPMLNGNMDWQFVYALWEMNIGLVAGATETLNGLVAYLPYLRMIITDSILAKTVINQYYPNE
jgi:hypothetical protein